MVAVKSRDIIARGAAVTLEPLLRRRMRREIEAAPGTPGPPRQPQPTSTAQLPNVHNVRATVLVDHSRLHMARLSGVIGCAIFKLIRR